MEFVDVGVRAGARLQPRVHEHRVAGRVRDVGRHQLIAVGRAGRGDRAAHPGRIGRHRVREIARLQVGERRAIGHHILQRLDVGVVDRRLVHIGQHAIGDGEPHLRGGVAGGAHAVLAGQVEEGRGSRCTRCDRRWRGRGYRPDRYGEQHGGADADDGAEPADAATTGLTGITVRDNGLAGLCHGILRCGVCGDSRQIVLDGSEAVKNGHRCDETRSIPD